MIIVDNFCLTELSHATCLQLELYCVNQAHNLPTLVKMHKLLQVCKQVVTNLFTSCQQVVFALLVPSCCDKFWNKLLITCNKLDGIIRPVAKLF
jgi:hypothetical protein